MRYYAKYTVNCQFFALNLEKITPTQKKLHEHARGARDKYQVWLWSSSAVFADSSRQVDEKATNSISEI